MKEKRYLRLVVLITILAAIAVWEIKREYRPSVLNAGVHLYAYVANAGDGDRKSVV